MLAELVVLVIWVKHVVASCDKWCLNLLGTVLKLLALPSDLRVLRIICLYTQCTCCLYLLYLWDNSFFFVSQGKGIPSIDELEYLAEACKKCIQSWVPPAVWNVFAPHQKNLPRSLRLQTCINRNYVWYLQEYNEYHKCVHIETYGKPRPRMTETSQLVRTVKSMRWTV